MDLFCDALEDGDEVREDLLDAPEHASSVRIGNARGGFTSMMHGERILKELKGWKLEFGLELYEVLEDFARGDALEESDEVLDFNDFTEVPQEVREDLVD